MSRSLHVSSGPLPTRRGDTEFLSNTDATASALKADIRTESRLLLANDRFGEKSGHSGLCPGLIGPDFT